MPQPKHLQRRSRTASVASAIALATMTSAIASGQSDAVADHGVIPSAEGGWLAEVTRNLRALEYHLRPKPADSGWTAPNRAHELRVSFDAGELTVASRWVASDLGESAERLSLRFTTLERAQNVAVFGPVVDEQVAEGGIAWSRSGSVSERHLSDARGIATRLTLATRPEGSASEPVVLTARVEGDLSPYPTADGRGVTWRSGGVDRVRIGGLRVTDSAGAELGACFDFTAGSLSISIVDRDASYPLGVDYLITGPEWSHVGSQEGGLLGTSLATAGDVNGDGYSDVIVGADFWDGAAGIDEGAVFVFHGSASGLESAVAWSHEGGQADGHFGFSVSTAGDVNGDGYSDVIVGAVFWDGAGGADEGAVFVFHGSSVGLEPTAAWSQEGGQAGAGAGGSVSTAGDVDGDGYADVIVGASGWDGAAGAEEGAVFVFRGSGSGVDTSSAWCHESGRAAASLGHSVSTAGDVNGDGYSDVIAGAFGWDGGGVGAGAAFVFHGSGSGLEATPAWSHESADASSWFGLSVSTAGDVNGDGYSDVIVGAPVWGPSPVGAVFVFHGAAAGLEAIAAWRHEGTQPSSELGWSVSNAGDVDGDGYADVVVGAPSWSGAAGSGEGAVFVYRGGASGLAPMAAWNYEGGEGLAQLGYAVSTAGDVNGDGYSDVIAGAPARDDGVRSDVGAAFVFHGGASGVAVSSGWSFTGSQRNEFFGGSVATAGDVNGDGFSDVIVGSHPWTGAAGNGEGAAFLFLGSASGLEATAAWSYESGQPGARLGWSVSTAGDVNGDGYSDAIVGAITWSGAVIVDGGAVFVFHGSASGLEATAAWSYESGQAGAWLGGSVSTAGDVNGDGYSDVIVGSPQWDGAAGSDEGAAFLFLGSATGLEALASWSNESGQVGSWFGTDVSTAGDVDRDGYSDVIVGACFWDGASGIDEGAAFVYHGSSAGLEATASWSYESGQTDALLGNSVSTAGDVNGDGYSEVVVGAEEWDGVTGGYEGAAFVFHGSGLGLESAPAWSYESGQAGAWFGASVSTAGDVNGDGYSDVIVGAYDWNPSREGSAFLFHGSGLGLERIPAWSHVGGQGNAEFGVSVSTAGDVNGDGYSDVVIGARRWDDVENDAGAAFLFYGNDGDGLDRIPRQARADGSAPIDLLGLTTDPAGFLLRANGRSPLGRDRVRLEWEVEPLGVPFDGVGIQVSEWFDTGAPGAAGSVVPLEELHGPLLASGPHKWRLRLRGAISGLGVGGGAAVTPYPWQSHWMSLPLNNVTETDLRVVAGGILPCALVAVDLMTAPVSPVRAPPWVYDLDCGAGTPDRLNPAQPTGRVAAAAPEPGVTTFETAAPGGASTLTLYQLDCACADDIKLVKSTTTDELILH